jgi:hypothetical protein
MQRNCYTSKTRPAVVKFLYSVVFPAMLMTIAFAPHAAAAPVRAVCSQIGMISPQFASFNAEVGDRHLGQELRDLVEQPTSMDPLWELRNLVRWEADIVQRAALEAEDGGLKRLVVRACARAHRRYRHRRRPLPHPAQFPRADRYARPYAQRSGRYRPGIHRSRESLLAIRINPSPGPSVTGG